MHRLCHILLFLLPMISVGQNLVPNGDFEIHNGCPGGEGGIIFCNTWSNHFGSVDYFHVCGEGTAGDTINVFGHQQPYSDSAYIGLLTFYSGFVGSQEIVKSELSSPLVAGVKYRLSFAVSIAESINYATCCVGLILSNQPPPNPPFSSNLSDAEVIIDLNSANLNEWYEVDTTYIATGGETTVYLGSFRPEIDSNPTYMGENTPGNDIAYMYIDNVSVVEDELVQVQEPEFTFSIYPNPATTNLTIESRTPLAQVCVRDVAGRAIMNETLRSAQSDKHTFDVSGLPSGIYLVEVLTQNGQRSVQKVVVE